MPARTLLRAKGRSESGRFLALPFVLTESPNYCRLSHLAARMLIEVARQYNGRNNGDLAATAKTLGPRGWNSNESITRALKELEHYGFIVRTRQGGLNRCNLYAITWKGIDECGGKLDVSANPVPTNNWKQARSKFRYEKSPSRAIDPPVPMSAARVPPRLPV